MSNTASFILTYCSYSPRKRACLMAEILTNDYPCYVLDYWCVIAISVYMMENDRMNIGPWL
jgi:hypothetical protein